MSAEPRYPTVHVEVRHDEIEEASSHLWALGATGIEERDATTIDKAARGALLVAHFEGEDPAHIAAAALPWPARVEHIVGDAWRDRWKEFFKPARIGERLVVRPPWEEIETREHDIAVTIDPGQAFGTGTHESTRLVLGELERRVHGGERVLDVGCGSGILSIAALLLGAARATAIDLEPLAAEAAASNAASNGVADRLAASTTPMSRIRAKFDLVLANIESKVLIPHADTLLGKLAPGGLLILSGLLVSEEKELRAAYRAMRFVGRSTERDWVALVFRAPGRSPRSAPGASRAK